VLDAYCQKYGIIEDEQEDDEEKEPSLKKRAQEDVEEDVNRIHQSISCDMDVLDII
jgi:hypothetical protein